jgi:hypothetical protein
MHRLLIAAFAWGLLGAAAAQSAPRQGVDAPERAAGNPDKIVCKTFTRIGSLADRYRSCKTKAQWERERTDHQDLGKVTSCRMNDLYAEPCK